MNQHSHSSPLPPTAFASIALRVEPMVVLR